MPFPNPMVVYYMPVVVMVGTAHLDKQAKLDTPDHMAHQALVEDMEEMVDLVRLVGPEHMESMALMQLKPAM